MKDFEALCTDLSRVEFQAPTTAVAMHVAFRAVGDVGKVLFSVVPKGCTGLSPTSHMGGFCPVHPDA